LIDKRERDYQEFSAFLSDFVGDLNNKSEEGWSVLVEGLRDRKALRKLGYVGDLVTKSDIARSGVGAFEGLRKVIILTDLDREGNYLASKFVRTLSHERVQPSLGERLRLKAASRGVFLHVENLARFARPEGSRWEPAIPRPPSKPKRGYRQGLGRFRRKATV
jgi:5S rRNA maturation endonuclease (ribonuclease M5)